MVKKNAKEFWAKNKGKIILIGGITVGAALFAIGYKKGIKDVDVFIRDRVMFYFDEPIALKDLIGSDEILDNVCDAYDRTKDALTSGIAIMKF